MEDEIAAMYGRFDGELKDLVSGFPGFYPDFLGDEYAEKYQWRVSKGGESYLMTVSRNRDPYESDIQITVIGPSKERADKIMKEFLDKAGIEAHEDHFMINMFEERKEAQNGTEC